MLFEVPFHILYIYLQNFNFFICWFLSYFIVVFSQLSPVMSQKRKSVSSNLCQEELEIRRVLDSPETRSTVSAPTPAQHSDPRGGDVASAPITLNDMKLLFEQFSNNLNKSVQSLRVPPPESDEEGDEIDSELPVDYGPDSDVSYADVQAPPMFGVNINEELQPSLAMADVHVPAPGSAPLDIPIGASGSRPPTHGAQLLPSSDVAPDAQLPCGVSERPPKNWNPHPAVVSWAKLVIDKVEWTDVERKALATDYSPDPADDHLFTAVPAPPGLLKAIKDPLTWERDYLFKRAETERLLLEANKDLVAGYRPLLEVLSLTKDVEGLETIRVLLSKVFMSMASSSSYITRGRRELGRRFVPLETAPSLFSNKPSHHSWFGFESVDAAVQKAVEAKNVNKDLVRLPQRHTSQTFQKKSFDVQRSWKGWKGAPRPFPGTGYGGYQGGKFRGGQKNSGKKRGSRGRGRGRGAKKAKQE